MNGRAVLGPRHERRGHPRLDDVEVPVLDTVGVHEVETLVLHALEEPGAFGDLDGVPAHVRNDVGRQELHLAGPLPHALGFGSVFDAGFEQHLEAHADAQDGPAAGNAAADHPDARPRP